MNSVDLVVLVFIGFFSVRGFFRGLIQEILALAQIFALILFITTYIEPFTHLLSRFATPVNYWVALGLGVVSILIIFGLISLWLQKLTVLWNLSFLNRILGFFLGILFGIFFCFLAIRLLLFISDTTGWTSLKSIISNWISQSRLLQTVLGFLTTLLNSSLFKAS